jgi:hypothetical protein
VPGLWDPARGEELHHLPRARRALYQYHHTLATAYGP